MSKIASERDTNTNEVKKIRYDTLDITPQQHEDGTTKDYLFFTLNNEDSFLNYPLDEIALKDEHEQIIGKQAATKIFTINDPDDSDKLKRKLIEKFGILRGTMVRIGGKRKRKTRKSKRPRKSKKSKRKTNRKKI